MSSWSCPHDVDNVCQRVKGARCDPGMRGCILHGRFRFAADVDGTERKPEKAPPQLSPAASRRSTRQR